MPAPFIPVLLVALGLLVAVSIATLWAEVGGKRPRHEDTERDPWDDPAEEDAQPWEQPGAVRRDCEPHRGTTVLWLGRFSLWIIAWVVLLGAVALLAVLPLAFTVLAMAARDRAKMRAGTMDPAGERLTAKGVRYARAALVTLVLALLAVAGLVASMLWLDVY
jgi:hypothetical protein